MSEKPECHEGCQSLVLKQKIEQLTSKCEEKDRVLRRVLDWCQEESPDFEIDADVVNHALSDAPATRTVPDSELPTVEDVQAIYRLHKDDPPPPDAFVTTDDRCSNCKSKLSNAETSRLEYQQQAHDLAKKLKGTVPAALDPNTFECPDVIEAHIQADRRLPPETVKALSEMIRVAYKAAKEGKLPPYNTGTVLVSDLGPTIALLGAWIELTSFGGEAIPLGRVIDERKRLEALREGKGPSHV